MLKCTFTKACVRIYAVCDLLTLVKNHCSSQDLGGKHPTCTCICTCTYSTCSIPVHVVYTCTCSTVYMHTVYMYIYNGWITFILKVFSSFPHSKWNPPSG